MPDAAVTLLLTIADEADADAVEADLEETVADCGGRIEDHRAFDTVVATVPQVAVGDVCAVDGLAQVETENAVAIGPDDAGEDVEFEGPE